MTRIVAIIGSAPPVIASGAQTLPMSDRGAIALALARFSGDVRAYAADADARCFARAAGVETVEEISDPELGAFAVALIGRGGCAERGDLLPARLAEASGAALVYDVIDVQRDTDGLTVTRDLGRGARDLLSVRGRAVLVVAESVERGPYVSRYRMNAVKVASGESVARKEQSCVEWEPTTPRVRLGDHAARVAGSAVERMNALFGAGEIAENTASLVRGSAEECARHLLRYLSHHGFVERGLGGEPRSASEGAVALQAAARRLERKQSAAEEAMSSQAAARRPERSTVGAASIPTRLRRRPRTLHQHPLATRGPFEIGVDI
jgi:hypothetical protein